VQGAFARTTENNMTDVDSQPATPSARPNNKGGVIAVAIIVVLLLVGIGAATSSDDSSSSDYSSTDTTMGDTDLIAEFTGAAIATPSFCSSYDLLGYDTALAAFTTGWYRDPPDNVDVSPAQVFDNAIGYC
jgi:hypothetical protein